MIDPTREREARERLAATYSDYERSGRAERWRGDRAGDRSIAEERERWLVGVLRPFARSVVIDIGCGDANVARALERDESRPSGYVGVDLLLERIRRAREASPWVRLAIATALHLPFADGGADVAVASTLFSSLPDAWQRTGAAAEIARSLRAGGRVVVYDLRYPSPGNPAVRRVSIAELHRLFPAWRVVEARTLTVLPPLARSRLFGSRRGYAILSRVPLFRSHLGVVLEKPR